MQGDGTGGCIRGHLLNPEDVSGQVSGLCELLAAQAGEIHRLHFLAGELNSVFASILGHQHAVRIERHIKCAGDQGESVHGGDKADVIHIQAHPLVAHAIIQHGNYAKRFERLFDHLVRAAIEVQAAQTRCGEQRWRLGEDIFLLPVQGRGLGLHRIVGQLIQVLCHFRILGVELACMFERGVRAGRISAEPVLGRGLNQRRYGVAAGLTSPAMP